NDFGGATIGAQTQGWIGINGWHDVYFPAHQAEDLRRQFGVAALAVTTRAPADAERRISERLAALGEADAWIRLVPGTGYHPARRARFLEMGSTLSVCLNAMSLLLLVSLLASSWMRAEQQQHGETVR